MTAFPPDARLRAAQQGDRDAAQAVLGELLPRVRNLVRYLVRGDREEADTTQQVLIDILRGLPTYRGDAPFEKWADRITARTTLALAKRRRTVRQREQETATALYALPSADESARYLARRDLARLLDTLPDEQREALVLHHLLELTVPEVAETLGVPFDTAKSRLRLALKKLRAAAADETRDRHVERPA